MRIPCYLRELRGKRSMKSFQDECGIHPARLSQIERGVMLPFDHEIETLEKAYGAPLEEWYPPRVLLVMEFDHRDE